ncbi:hypothetical protein, partial [Flavobacterium caeni]|uniref:hypothetical protein n=1 Tax=Flavobacterium caeni TaxID=490189 RepID=UPI001B8CB545
VFQKNVQNNLCQRLCRKVLVTAHLRDRWFSVAGTFWFHELCLSSAERTQFALARPRKCAKR